jgi:RNA polymerase sigma-70 factor, ECF subfamily
MPEHDGVAVALARGGDSEAFRLLVERHSRSVFNLAYRVTGSRQDAEDVVQETFLKAYRQLARFESRASFGTWVHRIAMNCSVDLLRARPSREHAADTEHLNAMTGSVDGTMVPPTLTPERLMASTQVGNCVEQAMTRLSPLERAAFVLRHYEGRSIDEISRALHIGEGAAKHSIFRAVRKMRAALQPFVD